MRGFAGYLLIGCLAIAAMALATVAGLGLAVGARPVAAPGQIIQHVDRTHKGDRLDLRRSSGTPAMIRPAQGAPNALPVGCEPAFSTLAAAAANDSGRCVAEFSINHRAIAG